MTRVEKAIQQEEENKKNEQAKKRNNFILKIVYTIVFFALIIALIIYGYINYQKVDSSKNVAEQVGKIVDAPNDKKTGK